MSLNVEFTGASIYQEDKLILSNISLTINKGELVYLTGKVGCGKTSIIKTINAELPLKKGKAEVLGYKLESINRNEIPYLRRRLGVVFQDFQLLIDRNIYENLKFVLQATGWDNLADINLRIKEVLARVKLNNKENSMPNQLSGGEQQRIVIARSLLNDPDLVLADEPTGNMDPATADDIMKILMTVIENGRTAIIATHDYAVVKKFKGRILRIEDSRIKEIGTSAL